MKNVTANAPYWIAGLLVAAGGIVCARVVGPSLGGSTRIAVTIGGQLLALFGLFIICLGVRRRIKQTAGH